MLNALPGGFPVARQAGHPDPRRIRHDVRGRVAYLRPAIDKM